ncbi:MAG: hypothetical protein IPN17_29565 [Deltaproteobacteria bacterium]|nr:hypothetical protein [Deltaproteobacteria bacterium]
MQQHRLTRAANTLATLLSVTVVDPAAAAAPARTVPITWSVAATSGPSDPVPYWHAPAAQVCPAPRPAARPQWAALVRTSTSHPLATIMSQSA